MSLLAYVGATSHVGAIIKNPDALPERSSLLKEAWERMTAEIAEARLDAVVVVGTDHFETFNLENHPTFCLGVAESYAAWGEFGNPGGEVPGAPGVSSALLEGLVHRGFDLSRSHEMPLDHAYMVPILRLGLASTPVIPLYINCNTPPLATLARCRDLGAAIRETVAAIPGDLRIGLIATGGVSHWVGLPQFGDINPEWDRAFLDLFANADLDRLVAFTDEEILEDAGNGALEIRTWILAQAAAGNPRSEVLQYQPMDPWGIGIGIVRMEAAR
jgi:aromatic ring-opening dioxygenase catalytic subunit (LigB family)